MIEASTDADFPIVFDDPADAELAWHRDDMHMPFAMPPLAADWVRRAIGASFNLYFAEFDSPQRIRGGVWNGYGYYSYEAGVPEDKEPAADAAWIELLRSRIPLTARLWNDEILPELKRIYGRIASIPADELDPDAAAAAWLDAWTGALQAWKLHFITIMGPYQVLEDLADAYKVAMGEGRDAEALGLVGGGHHELEEVEAGIEQLADLAEGRELAAALETATAAPAGPVDIEALRGLPGGERFVRALDAFLVEHGHLGQSHDDLRQPSWAEAPGLLLEQVAQRLRQPARSSAAREAELTRTAGELEAAAKAALADRPDELARFETVLGHAREIGHLTEGHNYWIDRMSQARMRALAMRFGARLAREGVIDEPDDIFFLDRDGIADALRDHAPRQQLIAERRREHARNERITPPRYIGRIPTEERVPTDRFDGPRLSSDDPDLLRGTGASAGVVRGLARVVLTQDDFGRIEPGDVIVCPSSNPSWVPVFTIAGGLVTNTGGVLSHAAVVAREFGLPAVVGTVDATTRIADGRLVEIDGTSGTVRLL